MLALLAIDDDRRSSQAAAAAAAWLPTDCHVVALHVGPSAAALATAPPPGAGLVGPGYATHLASAMPSDEELEAAAARVAADALAQHPGDVRIERGDPVTMICQVATETDADLIVVGTGDRSWLERLFKPSVSAGVATEAPCSVLIVRTDPPTEG